MKVGFWSWYIKRVYKVLKDYRIWEFCGAVMISVTAIGGLFWGLLLHPMYFLLFLGVPVWLTVVAYAFYKETEHEVN